MLEYPPHLKTFINNRIERWERPPREPTLELGFATLAQGFPGRLTRGHGKRMRPTVSSSYCFICLKVAPISFPSSKLHRHRRNVTSHHSFSPARVMCIFQNIWTRKSFHAPFPGCFLLQQDVEDSMKLSLNCWRSEFYNPCFKTTSPKM